MNQKKYRDVLPSGYQLHWYELLSVLGRGAYGITYLATDKNLQQSVAIKEYLPNEFASRENDNTVHPVTGEQREIYEWGLDRFLREARTLAKFKHHNIVRVLSVFEKNNTAYMVMEYEQGEDLAKILKAHKNMLEEKLLSIFTPILTGLSLVHAEGFIHRDIKPSNIYIRQDKSPVLIDFGSARQTKHGPTRALTSLVTYGYAPFEQYNEGEDKQGPWTDLYAMAASVYLAMVGKLPMDALSRGSSLLNDGVDSYEPVSIVAKDRFSPHFLLAVDNAMMFRAQDRPQSASQWADMLTGKIPAPPLPATLLVPKNIPTDSKNTVLMPGDYVSFRHTNGQSPQAAVPSNGNQHSTVARATNPSQRINSHISEHTDSTPELETRQPSGRQQHSPTTSTKKRKGFGVTLALLAIIGIATAVTLSIIKPWNAVPDSGSDTAKPENPPVTTPEDTAKAISAAKITALLQLAQSDITAQNILAPDNNNARQRYLEVLQIDPNNAAAKDGLKKVTELQAILIEDQLNNNYTNEAEKNIALLAEVAPNLPATLTLQRRLDKISQSERHTEIEQLLQQAKQHFEKHRLIKPSTNNAFNSYQRVLEKDPNNEAAKTGIQAIISYYQAAAEKHIEQRNYSKASRIINNIEYINPDSVVARRLNDIVSKARRIRTQVSSLLTKAKQNFQIGNLVTPSDNNALYHYHQVLTLEPSNRDARQGIVDIENHFKKQFDAALAANNFNAAKTTLTTMQAFAPDAAITHNASTALAKAQKAATPTRSDIEIISEIIGQYKSYFESGNIPELEKLSHYNPGRKDFVTQFFDQYQSVTVLVSGFRYIGKEHKGLATISLTELLNKRGNTITPGTWGKFDIVINQNALGEWKIVW